MSDEIAPTTLHLLCAGASQGLISALQPRLSSEYGAVCAGRFGAVGAMKEAWVAGEPCDLVVLTQPMIEEMVAAGEVLANSVAPLGVVRTGVALRQGQAAPDVSTPAALAAALRAADEIYFPDPVRATAGIHVAKVLRSLGLHDELSARFRTFPNGATSMRHLAQSGAPMAIGLTQVTEILFTPGVSLAALLPPEFELATTYTAAVPLRAAHPARALEFVRMLTAPDTAQLRQRCGFDH
jgi:molybdate transport system substrate-binding protein